MLKDYILQNIKKKLKEHKSFQAVIKRSKKIGRVEIEMTSYEKWNYNEVNIAKNDGTFDVEGKSWEDVRGKWNWNYMNIKDLYNIIKDLFLYKSFTKIPSSWVWVVESFDMVKTDLAEELALKKVPLDSLSINIEQPLSNVDKNLLDKYNFEVKQILKKINKQDILNHLNNICYQISNNIFVLKDDPTIMICNNENIPFELKDGWSDRQICGIIGRWFYHLGYNIPVVIGE